jgi:arylsulfatase A-like enzyme
LAAAVRLAVAGLALAALGCPAAPREVAYDLAARLPWAERWSSRTVLLFGTPATEPQLAEGFYREAVPAEGDPFVWSRGEAEVALAWPSPRPRFAVADLAPYKGVKRQEAEVRLNGTSVARFTLNDARHRYGFALPAEAQRAGENRLRFVFADTASPADQPGNPDRRQLAAAFYSLAVGEAGDAGLEDLLGRDAPRPFTVTKADGVPTLVEVGPSVVRYAVRIPASGELRFTPDLHPGARAAGASASFRVTEEARAGEEQELWSAVLDARSPRPDEVRVALRGSAGDIVRIGLHVGPAGKSERFAWGRWRAPRVMGRTGSAATERTRPSAPPEARRAVEDGRARLGAANVLLVVLDAARADHFGAYGYARETTPQIDRLAREGVVFDRVFTPAAYTLGAMSSVWTSQYPDRHHAEVSFASRLPPDRLTLAELLGAQGLHTAGFVSNTVAGGLNGFDRGFSEFHEVWREQATSGAEGLGRAVPAWLAAQGGRRFFAYVHFREPHAPYDPPPPFDTRFGPEGPIPKSARRAPGDTWITDVNQGRRALTGAEREHLVRLYDGNLAHADDVVGQVRAALEQAGLLERTVVIVTADHGEALQDHGWIGHNVQVYEESIHVPLIVRFPAGKGMAAPGTRIGAFADLLDVAPTIADVFGVLGRGGSDRRFQGRSLLETLAGAPGGTATLSRTIWDRPRYARRDATHAFLYDTRTGEEQLYDVVNDPGQTRNLVSSDPLRAAWARESLHEWIASVARGEATGPAVPTRLTREQCENLKALGYIAADFKCPAE